VKLIIRPQPQPPSCGAQLEPSGSSTFAWTFSLVQKASMPIRRPRHALAPPGATYMPLVSSAGFGPDRRSRRAPAEGSYDEPQPTAGRRTNPLPAEATRPRRPATTLQAAPNTRAALLGRRINPTTSRKRPAATIASRSSPRIIGLLRRTEATTSADGGRGDGWQDRILCAASSKGRLKEESLGIHVAAVR